MRWRSAQEGTVAGLLWYENGGTPSETSSHQIRKEQKGDEMLFHTTRSSAEIHSLPKDVVAVKGLCFQRKQPHEVKLLLGRVQIDVSLFYC